MTQPEDLKALTSLRFFAAASIVWLHAKLYFPWAGVGPNLPWAQGVSFFFVLSGFILTHVYGNGRLVSYQRFLLARFARLWPTHIATLAAVYFLVRVDSQSFDGPGLLGKWSAMGINAVLLHSWIPTTSSQFSWNGVSWSISTEMFFYGLFPFLLALMSRSVIAVLAIGAAPAVLLMLVVPLAGLPAEGGVFEVTGASLLYPFPPSRLFEFSLGMVAYVFWQRWRATLGASKLRANASEVVGLVVAGAWLGYGFFAMSHLISGASGQSQWFNQAGSSLVFAGVLIVMASASGFVGRMLCNRVLVKLGEVSFAIYMTHQIVMKIVVLNFPRAGNPVAVGVACLGAGFMAHYLVERPARGWIMRLRMPVLTRAPST